MRVLAKRLLKQFKLSTDDNFITGFAYKFPTLVMCDMLGISEQEYSDEVFLALNQAIADSFVVFETRALSEKELSKADLQMDFLMGFFGDLFEKRRLHPQNDLTSALV